MSRIIRKTVSAAALACVFAAFAGPGVSAAAAAEQPYVDDEPPYEWHLFLRPKKDDPASQWAWVQELEGLGKHRKAARQAHALREWWPLAPEAAPALLFYARSLETRGDLEGALEAYQLLLDEYATSCDFDAILATRLKLANELMIQRHCAFWGLPGFEAPARAIPYFQSIVDTAPEWQGAAEALFRIGQAHERENQWEEAIEAYFLAMNRFPESSFAADAAVAQARCHVAVADETPNDARARDLAIAACDLVLARYPSTPRRVAVEEDKLRLLERRREADWQLALYYDKTLKNPEAARIHYRQFVALHPDAPETPRAAARLAELEPAAPAVPATPQEK